MKHYWKPGKYLLLFYSSFKLESSVLLEAVGDNRSHVGFEFGEMTVDQLSIYQFWNTHQFSII